MNYVSNNVEKSTRALHFNSFSTPSDNFCQSKHCGYLADRRQVVNSNPSFTVLIWLDKNCRFTDVRELIEICGSNSGFGAIVYCHDCQTISILY